MPTAFVTGASGSIGPILVQRLLEKGYKVRVLIRQSELPLELSSRVEIVQGEINDYFLLKKASLGIDVIFHLAAKLHINNPPPNAFEEYKRINVDGTRVLISAAKEAGVRRVILFSTINVYGPTQPGQIWDEKSPLCPVSLYSQTKCEAEAIALDAKGRDMSEPLSVVLRLASVYGSRMTGNYARLVKALGRGYFIPVGIGQNRRTLVYVQDAVSAALLAAEHPQAYGQIYNVTDGKVHKFREILNAVSNACGRGLPKFYIPERTVRIIAGFLEKVFIIFGRNCPINISLVEKLLEDVAVSGHKIKRELGFRAKFDLATGWRESVRHMDSRK